MPRYDYHCPACDNTFEVTQNFASEPAAACPVCGGAARRLISHPAIHFKGSGFYSTDNRSSSAANSASRESRDEPTPSKKTEKAESTADSASKPASTDKSSSSDS